MASETTVTYDLYQLSRNHKELYTLLQPYMYALHHSVHYRLVGMLEMVTDASTLRAIQTEHGVTGSFKDKPLSEWLMRHNPSEQAYKEVR